MANQLPTKSGALTRRTGLTVGSYAATAETKLVGNGDTSTPEKSESTYDELGATPVPPRQIDSTAIVWAMVRKLELASNM